jgi:hypothetical protein
MDQQPLVAHRSGGSGNAELKTMVEGFQMPAQGLRQLGSGELDAGGSRTPGILAPIAVVAATANPIGLIVGGVVKLHGDKSGSEMIEGSAKRTAEAIAKQLRGAFEKRAGSSRVYRIHRPSWLGQSRSSSYSGIRGALLRSMAIALSGWA